MSKRDKVEAYLLDGNTITSYEAFTRFGATRLSSIIFDLKKRGHNIVGDIEKHSDGTRYMRYRIED